MATEERSLLTEVISAAGRAAVWLGRAVVIALAGIAAAVMATVALMLQVIGTLLKGLAEMAAAALPVLLGLVPGLTRLVCLAFALGATAWSAWLVFLAFGGDWLAWVLAGLLAPAPFMVLYAPTPSWPRAVAVGAVALVGAGVLQASPPPLRMFLLFILFAWLMTRRLHRETFNDAGSN